MAIGGGEERARAGVMKIALQTWGSEGDVRPFIALGAGLRAAGHDVTLAVTHVANRDYSALGRSYGIPVRIVGHVDAALLHQVAGQLAAETSALRQVDLLVSGLLDPMTGDMEEAAQDLCQSHDLMVSHFLVHPAQAMAEQAGRPRVSLFLAPLLPTKHHPPPSSIDLGWPLNGIVWRVAGWLLNRSFLSRINATRRRAGLAPLAQVLGDSYRSPDLNLVAVSPALCPPPPDWDPTAVACGFLELTEPAWQMPDPLRSFLNAGPPPVFLTFGSMGLADPEAPRTEQLLVEAARLAGCRAILQSSGAACALDGPDLYRAGAVPHRRLFPRCAAVVHHGGSGTTHAAALSGRPSIVVEHVGDQSFWGGVLHRRGVAPRPLHRRTLTAALLARAIRSAVSSGAMSERALRLSSDMEEENGVARAVQAIESLMRSRRV